MAGGGYFFGFLSERITTSVITSINTSVYVRRSEKDTMSITSLLKRLRLNRLPRMVSLKRIISYKIYKSK